MSTELPVIHLMNYGSNSTAGYMMDNLSTTASGGLIYSKLYRDLNSELETTAITGDWLADLQEAQRRQSLQQKQQQPQPQQTAPMSKRIVKVYLADPDLQVPMEKSILYSGEEKATDLTDQELFFEIPVADLLKKHNEYRVTLPDKRNTSESKERLLEPIRIRDLKMVVVTVASF